MKAGMVISAAGRRRSRTLHLPLPEPVYVALRREAALAGKPATGGAREAIELWLRERRRAAVGEAIAAYAVEHAGTSLDLDLALERSAVEVLRPGRRHR